MYRVAVDDSGRVALPQRVIKSLASPNLLVASTSPAHVLLATEGQGVPSMAATLGEVGIADLLSFFNMFRKTGILYLTLADGDRQIFFQEGEIIFATSERLDDELGEILCELGKLERSQLRTLRGEMKSGDVLSQVLVKKNLVAARDLWLATRHQVECIVYNLFACHEGGGYFVATTDMQRDDIVRLSMSTQNLIMEGLRRIDERALYLRKLRSLDALLEYTGRAPNDLSDEEKRLLTKLYSGPASVGQMVACSGISEYDALRVLYQLADKKMVEVKAAEEPPLNDAFAELLEVFNGVLSLLYETVSPRLSGLREEVNRFMRSVPHPLVYVFRGVQIKADGTVDGRQLVKNLCGLELREQKRLLVDALTELVYMECMCARRELGAKFSNDLIQRVQEIVERAKKLMV